MQRLAREFNFPETTFVLPSERPGDDARVRIFTPATEVQFAGHPTIGTAAILVSRSAPRDRVPRTLILGEGIGPVVVAVDPHGPDTFAQLTIKPVIEHGPSPDRSAAAAVLSLSEDVVVDAWRASVGLRFCFVQLTTVAAVDRASVDRAFWATHFAATWSSNLFVFSGSLNGGGQWYARMFAPALGIEEDPATGSACAALAAVAAERAGDRNHEYAWLAQQGIVLGRPSEIYAGATMRDGCVSAVTIGGYTVITGSGEITVPDDD